MVMFWNVENYFDTYDNPHTSDEEFTPTGDNRWSRKRFEKKRDDIAKTLLLAADKDGEMPAIIGLAEIENEFVLDQLLEETPLASNRLCDGCDKCIHACPGHALDADGKRSDWQCAVYYNGANRSKNPFMPASAYADFPDRQAIMDGTAIFTGMEDAGKVLDASLFYPRIKHSYVASICGRACDTACYIHLEEQGKLARSFHKNFRIRPEWKLED